MKMRQQAEHEQETAQISAGAKGSFAAAPVCRKLTSQAYPSSTEMRLCVQNRYPSPLKRSAFDGRPLFLCRTAFERRVLAESNGRNAAKPRPFSNQLDIAQPPHAGACFPSDHKEGEQICEDQHSPLRSWRHWPLRAATRMPNAALWGQRAARFCPKQRAATPLPGPSLGGLRASFATTQGCASSRTRNLDQIQRNLSRGAAMRPGFVASTGAYAPSLGT